MLGGVDGFCLDIHMASPLWTRYRQVGKVCTEEAVARLQTLRGWLELSAGTGLKGHWAVWEGLAGSWGAEGAKAMPHVSIPEACRPAPAGTSTWLGSIFALTLPLPGVLPPEAVSVCSLPSPIPTRLGPPGVSAPAPLVCPCLGCVCLWLTAQTLLTCLPLILSCSQALGTGLVNSKRSLRACRQHLFGGASSQGSCWPRSLGLEDARPLPASLLSLLSSLCPTPTWLLLYNQINKSLSPESSFLLAVLRRPGNTPSPSYSKGATGEDLVRPPGLFGGCALCPSCCPFRLCWLNTSLF